MVPVLASPALLESTDQVTAELFVPVTVAVNCCCAPISRPELAGETESPMAFTVTLALAVFVESASLVAVTVCVPPRVGAVYSPAAVMVPVA